MALKTIKAKLTEPSLNDAIEQIRAYKREIQAKNELLVSRLADVGINVIKTTIASVPPELAEGVGTHLYSINSDSKTVTVVYAMNGGENALFIEFSSGWTYGTPPGGYPLPIGADYGVGTYPDQKHAYDPHGWWYTDKNGESRHTYGNRAYMPVYHSLQAMIMVVGEVAKEVWS